jgi:acetoacetyl-CoA synthetase
LFSSLIATPNAETCLGSSLAIFSPFRIQNFNTIGFNVIASFMCQTEMASSQQPLWKPKDPESTPISKYRNHINAKFGKQLVDSQQLHKWSVEHPQDFWIDLWSYVGLVPSLPSALKTAFDDSKSIKDVPVFFSGVRFNYAENIFHGKMPGSVALIGLRENDPFKGDSWTWAKLKEHVRRVKSALMRSGVKRGDTVAAVMSNCPWTIALFLACASFGAVFTSIAPEMGLEGIVGRLEQIDVRMLFVDSHQMYKGKMMSMNEKLARIVGALGASVEAIIVPVLSGRYALTTLDVFLARSSGADKLVFTRLPFTAPLVIVYSSGTTGSPKCIVHHHGTLLNLKKVSLLHNSLTPRDVVFQYTSTSWILWNIQNGHLSVGAPLLCYDGSPLYPDAGRILDICAHYGVTYLATSPRYLLELEMSGIRPLDFDLKGLRMVTTTGATLTESQFEWFYKVFPSAVHLSSVAGGTEISTSWIASDPAGPVYPAEMQMPALGHDVDVADAESGASIKTVGIPASLIVAATSLTDCWCRPERRANLFAEHHSHQCQSTFTTTPIVKSTLRPTFPDFRSFLYGPSMIGYNSTLSPEVHRSTVAATVLSIHLAFALAPRKSTLLSKAPSFQA